MSFPGLERRDNFASININRYMELNDWVVLITALGGIEGVKQLLKWWMNRKNMARIDDTKADREEFELLRDVTSFLEKTLSEKEQRFVEQTERLRQTQADLLQQKEENTELRIELALKKCEKQKCPQREPPTGY